MRIGMALDWWMHATSLTTLTKNMFRELGLLMNKKKSFTIAGIQVDHIGIGNVNQHYDCIHIPNMGGYRFPKLSILSCKNLILSPSGIDEVVLGREVFKNKSDWKRAKPVIDSEVEKWKKYNKFLKVVHVVTKSEKNDMMKFFKIPEDKFYIIPHGVDHDIFRPPTDKETMRKKILGEFYLQDSSYFIHVSESNWARKNIFNLLEAFQKAKEQGLKQNLIIVGKNDEIIHKSATRISGVSVLGFVNENNLVNLLGCADALILPSKHEGFGLPLLESMSCGTPCITSNVYSPPEVVADSGLLVDPKNVTDISKKMLELGSNENQRKYLAKKALELSQKYSWKATAIKLFELYKSTISNEKEQNFEENYDLAAYRTITTVSRIKSSFKDISTLDLLKFDFTKIIKWCLAVGLKDPEIKDFLIPFKDWMIKKTQ